MYARVSTMTVKQDSIEEAIAGANAASDRVAALPGLVQQIIFADRSTGDAVSIAIYDTAENRAAALETANAIFADMAPLMASAPTTAEFEVVAGTQGSGR